MEPRSSGAELVWREVRDPQCDRCGLGVGGTGRVAQTVCLTGSGRLPALGVVVGEGPGPREDVLERPFVGTAGAYLQNVLLDCGVELEDLFFTNATKCLPPQENKDDWVAQAVKPCQPYLVEELRRARPRAVLLCGNAALQSVTGMRGILRKRGLEYRDEELDAYVVATLHPSAVLRVPAHHSSFFADVMKFARRLRGEAPLPRPEVTVCRTVAEVRDALDSLRGAPFTADLETQGLGWWRPHSKIWCVGLSNDPKKAFLVPLEHPESPFVEGPDVGEEVYSYGLATRKRKEDEVGPQVREWLARPWQEVARPELHEVWKTLRGGLSGAQVNGHNFKYDSLWLTLRDVDAEVWFDTILAAHILDENRELNLESLCTSELGLSGWGKGSRHFDPPDALDVLGPYCGADAAYDHALYLKLRERLNEDAALNRVYNRVARPASRVFRNAERHGIWLDRERAVGRLAKWRVEREKIDKKLLRQIPTASRPQADALLVKGKSPFASVDFLNMWLFAPAPDGLGLPPLRRVKDKKGRPRYSTDEETLAGLAGRHPAVDLMLERRAAEKTCEFFESWLDAADGEGYVHPSFNLTGTVTGRKSSGFHTVPRESTRAGLRSIFGAPEGWVFVEGDFSQIELRVAAWLADEPTMLAVFRNGGDIHLYTAGLVTGKLTEVQQELGLKNLSVAELSAVPEFNRRLAGRVTKEERRKAKAVNFGFLYGMGAQKFQIYARESYDAELTMTECEQFRGSYFETYDRLPAWHREQSEKVRKYQEVPSEIGRRRRLPMVVSEDWGIQHKAERQAINAPVQGLVPDLVQLSVNELVEEFDPAEARFLGEVHDAALFMIRADSLTRWLPRIKEVLEHPPVERYFNVTVPVPLEVDLSVGRYWGETSEEEAKRILGLAA